MIYYEILYYTILQNTILYCTSILYYTSDILIPRYHTLQYSFLLKFFHTLILQYYSSIIFSRLCCRTVIYCYPVNSGRLVNPNLSTGSTRVMCCSNWNISPEGQSSRFFASQNINIFILEDLGATRPSFQLLRRAGALWAPWGPAGPAGGLRPPVGLQYPNFEL